jgi:hypothetical protein
LALTAFDQGVKRNQHLAKLLGVQAMVTAQRKLAALFPKVDRERIAAFQRIDGYRYGLHIH